MSIRTGMFVVAGMVMVSTGCTPRHILRMSSPEQASTVTLFDQGEERGVDEDDEIIVLKEPTRIARVAAFFQARSEKWKPLNGKPPLNRRYQISFRKRDAVSDRFWLDGSVLGLNTPAGDYFTCELSDAERKSLLNLFSDSR